MRCIVAGGRWQPNGLSKGIAIASANNKSVLEFEGVDEVPMPGPPLICIPTTSGSSADVSQFAIIADTLRKLKIAIVSKTVVPDVSLIDPATTTTMPAELTAATGLDEFGSRDGSLRIQRQFACYRPECPGGHTLAGAKPGPCHPLSQESRIPEQHDAWQPLGGPGVFQRQPGLGPFHVPQHGRATGFASRNMQRPAAGSRSGL